MNYNKKKASRHTVVDAMMAGLKEFKKNKKDITGAIALGFKGDGSTQDNYVLTASKDPDDAILITGMVSCLMDNWWFRHLVREAYGIFQSYDIEMNKVEELLCMNGRQDIWKMICSGDEQAQQEWLDYWMKQYSNFLDIVKHLPIMENYVCPQMAYQIAKVAMESKMNTNREGDEA